MMGNPNTGTFTMNATHHATGWIAPPCPDLKATGRRRRIGVEIEFAGVSVEAAAEAVTQCMGGTIRRESPHRTFVEGSSHGDFRIEVDMNLAHRPLEGDTGRALRDAVVELSTAVVPVEIVCPPIAWDEAAVLDDLCSALGRIGAEGTREGLLYAFGVQLNPEPPALDAACLRDTLRAFLLLRDWLRAEIAVDRLRRIWQFAQPFSEGYAALVLDPAYAPGLAGLIDDYLTHNPSRDRELDLLPLFCHLDAERVRLALPDEKINARPTWHYRLPNAELNTDGWSIGLEWARWVRVERLAANPDLLAEAAGRWLTRRDHLLPPSWTPQSVALAGRL
jgi:hypothetical protein